MRRLAPSTALIAVLTLLFAATAAATDHEDHSNRPEVYRVDLDPVPHPGDDGGSDTEGQAILMLRGNELTVRLHVRGASPSLVHAQHIHGIGVSTCPTSELAGSDGLISTVDGVPAYGSVQASLTTTGDTSAGSALAVDRFPVANENGVYNYQRTFTIPDSIAENLDSHHIVVHGIDLNNNGAYDFEAGPSSLTSAFPLEATIPTACGEIEAVNNR